jgi:hypothetical protein
MAMTLTNANNLTVEDLFRGVVEATLEEDELFNLLPFETIPGFKQFTYNKEGNLPAESQWIGPNDEVDESAPDFTQVTNTLKILADRIELDTFLVETKNAIQSVESANLASKSKMMMRRAMDSFYYGSTTTDPNQPNGLHNLVSTSSPDMVLAEGSSATGAALSISNLVALADLVKPGRPHVFAMPKAIRARLSAPYINNVNFNIDAGNFGNLLGGFGSIPIMVTDFLVMTETISGSTFSAKTGGATGSIFAIQFGRQSRVVPGANEVFNNDGLIGVMGNNLTVGPRLPLTKKIGFTRQMWWWLDFILSSDFSLARLDGITDAAAGA